jgi:hypothetical protein
VVGGVLRSQQLSGETILAINDGKGGEMKKTTKKLNLSRETVGLLDAEELPKVAGGDSFSGCSCSGRVCTA